MKHITLHRGYGAPSSTRRRVDEGVFSDFAESGFPITRTPLRRKPRGSEADVQVPSGLPWFDVSKKTRCLSTRSSASRRNAGYPGGRVGYWACTPWRRRDRGLARVAQGQRPFLTLRDVDLLIEGRRWPMSTKPGSVSALRSWEGPAVHQGAPESNARYQRNAGRAGGTVDLQVIRSKRPPIAGHQERHGVPRKWTISKSSFDFPRGTQALAWVAGVSARGKRRTFGNSRRPSQGHRR